jgi:Fur family zinc uptake transcriptional regulator
LKNTHEQLLLICKRCNDVQERHADLVMQALTQELQEANLIAHSKAIEIHGICANCSQ